MFNTFSIQKIWNRNVKLLSCINSSNMVRVVNSWANLIRCHFFFDLFFALLVLWVKTTNKPTSLFWNDMTNGNTAGRTHLRGACLGWVLGRAYWQLLLIRTIPTGDRLFPRKHRIIQLRGSTVQCRILVLSGIGWVKMTVIRTEFQVSDNQLNKCDLQNWTS